MQLIPEAPDGTDTLRDGAQLADDQVEPSVTLDDILSAFDPKTRADFQLWQQSVAEGINGKGERSTRLSRALAAVRSNTPTGC